MKAVLAAIVALALAGVPAVAGASLDSAKIEAMFGWSEAVAHVEVVGGEVLEVDGQRCGVRYRARVQRSYKGEATDADEIFVVGQGFLQIGHQYIVFLDRKDGDDLGKYVQSSYWKPEYIKACSYPDTRWEARPVQGALAVSWTEAFPTEASVLVPERAVELPESMYRVCGPFYRDGDDDPFLRPAWVRLKDMEALLTRLGEEKRD